MRVYQNLTQKFCIGWYILGRLHYVETSRTVNVCSMEYFTVACRRWPQLQSHVIFPPVTMYIENMLLHSTGKHLRNTLCGRILNWDIHVHCWTCAVKCVRLWEQSMLDLTLFLRIMILQGAVLVLISFHRDKLRFL